MKHPALTNRQSEVMCCLLRGMCSKEIARELGISINTVKCHLRDVYYRLNVSGRYKLMAKWGREVESSVRLAGGMGKET